MVTTGGWSPIVAASVLGSFIDIAALAGALLMVWRLLAAVAVGEVFSPRTLRWVRGIGWLVVAQGVAQPLLSLATKGGRFDYTVESFGSWPHLMSADAHVDLAQLALGCVILLVAAAFRHGVALEDEQRMTI